MIKIVNYSSDMEFTANDQGDLAYSLAFACRYFIQIQFYVINQLIYGDIASYIKW